MINIYDYVNEERKVKITFVDGTYAIGHIESIDDEEESDLGEDGLTLDEESGLWMGIGQSEIESITVIEQEEKR